MERDGGKKAKELDLHVTARWDLGCRVSNRLGSKPGEAPQQIDRRGPLAEGI